MEIIVKLHQNQYSINLQNPIPISIPLHFNDQQPNTYGVPKASSSPYRGEGWVGDVREGSGCNFEHYELIPHCNGTHTECIGHITYDRLSVNNLLKDSFIPATLISVQAVESSKTQDSYLPQLTPDDVVVTASVLQSALTSIDEDFIQALIIRTFPNGDFKKSSDYTSALPPFFTIEAMEYIKTIGVKHLLIDLPSVDRTYDEGRLSTHHIFWDIPQGSHIPAEHSMDKTITEMIYAPDDIPDGRYFLNLQIAPFETDASPSRPILYAVESLNR
ncbi:cyclase family protein [Algivirga pacifica]|uniref:Cyclase family protein n=1 Tax=Algivirga pacifica TaxID=1162670 RepID=A0ABP9DHX9_9BACT